jgi:hypothetical protein
MVVLKESDQAFEGAHSLTLVQVEEKLSTPLMHVPVQPAVAVRVTAANMAAANASAAASTTGDLNFDGLIIYLRRSSRYGT